MYVERTLGEPDHVGDYGHVIVDECHHLSAHSFEQVVRRAKARFVLGLSATVTRKDGHHPVIFMQCGPVRHRVDAKAQAAARPFEHTVIVRPTAFHSTGSTKADPCPPSGCRVVVPEERAVSPDAHYLAGVVDVESLRALHRSERAEIDDAVRRRGAAR